MLNASSVMRSSLELSAAGQTKCLSLIKSPIIPENTEPREKVKFWQSEKNVLIYPATSLRLINTLLCLTGKSFHILVSVRLVHQAKYNENERFCCFYISQMKRVNKRVSITLLEPSGTSYIIHK